MGVKKKQQEKDLRELCMAHSQVEEDRDKYKEHGFQGDDFFLLASNRAVET